MSVSLSGCIEALRFLDANEKSLIKLELSNLLVLLESSNPSDKTHYHLLDQWSEPIFDFINDRLNESGFVNADPNHNATIPCVVFWYAVYMLFSCIDCSPHLKTSVAQHHSSAKERNEAFIKEVRLIQEHLNG